MNLNDEQIAKFWERVNKDGAGRFNGRSKCWEWTGYVGKSHGRNCPMFCTAKDTMGNPRRIAYQLTHGYVPLRLFARCGNDLCVNPAHMSGRQSAALTVHQFMEAASMYASGQHSLEQIGKHFGVSRSAIWGYLNGRTKAFVEYLDNIPAEQIEAAAVCNRHLSSAVLTPVLVREARDLKRRGFTVGQIQYKLNLTAHRSTVERAIYGRSWAWVR